MKRIIVHIDLDCFFVQVEQQKKPELKHKCVAIQQHDDIIAVSYEAKSFGIKKHDKPSDAMKKCPHLILVHVEKIKGTTKVSYKSYRKASNQIFNYIANKIPKNNIEKTSIDEAFLDVTNIVEKQFEKFTKQGNISGDIDWKSKMYNGKDEMDIKLLLASQLTNEIRESIFTQLGYTSSAGISFNKLLSKLGSRCNKPNQQTIIFPEDINGLMQMVPIDSLPNIGMKLNKNEREQLQTLNIKMVADLLNIPRDILLTKIGSNSTDWLINTARGEDDEPVVAKGLPKSISVSMSLTPIFIDNTQAIEKVIGYLCLEIVDRLEEDYLEFNRNPIMLQFHYRFIDSKEKVISFPISLIDRDSVTNRYCKDTLLFVIMDKFRKSLSNQLPKKEKGNLNTKPKLRWISIQTNQFNDNNSLITKYIKFTNNKRKRGDEEELQKRLQKRFDELKKKKEKGTLLQFFKSKK